LPQEAFEELPKERLADRIRSRWAELDPADDELRRRAGALDFHG
jgi:hypothetical protein